MTPRVSVLMTIHNAAPYLGTALDSLLSQTLTDWELIALEHGSEDASRQILHRYAGSDPRIRVVEKPGNIGRTPALIEAMAAARAPYIAVLDADDVAYPSRLEKLVDYLDSRPDLAVVGSYCDIIDADGTRLHSYEPNFPPHTLTEALCWTNPVAHSTAVYRRKLVEAVGGYDPARQVAQDYALWIALARQHPIAVMPEILGAIRMSPEGLTRNPASRIAALRDNAELLAVAGRAFAHNAEVIRRNRDARIRADVDYAAALIASGNRWSGWSRVCSVILKHPVAFLDHGILRRTLPGFGFLDILGTWRRSLRRWIRAARKGIPTR